MSSIEWTLSTQNSDQPINTAEMYVDTQSKLPISQRLNFYDRFLNFAKNIEPFSCRIYFDQF